MDLKEERLLEGQIGDHWYYRGKAAAMRHILRDQPIARILDIGAGSGFFSRELLRTTHAHQATCIDTSYPGDSESTVSGKPIRFLRQSPGPTRADLVLMMDVLEHVDDDTGLIDSYLRTASPGTRLLITVPAFSFLWSGHDVFLEHKRRYTLPQIKNLVRSAGLEILRGSYYFGAVFPVAAVVRLKNGGTTTPHAARSDLRQHSRFVNSVLTWICRGEVPFMRFNRAFGLSVFCLAKKGSDPAATKYSSAANERSL